jgi:flavodoxin
MKVWVVYDSVFGNTQKIAQAIASAAGAPDEVHLAQVTAVQPDQLKGVDLLFVGSPTRGFRPTKPINEFLNGLALEGVKVAAFDTRIAVKDVNSAFLTFMVRIFGYAADPIAAKLKKKGGALIAAPTGFYVKASEGPLKEGELERAGDWARRIKALSVPA